MSDKSAADIWLEGWAAAVDAAKISQGDIEFEYTTNPYNGKQAR